jgi:hypothetical protein
VPRFARIRLLNVGANTFAQQFTEASVAVLYGF